MTLCGKYKIRFSGDALYELQGQLTRVIYDPEFDFYAFGRFYGQLLCDRRLTRYKRRYFRNLALADYEEFEELIDALESVQRLLQEQFNKERFWETSYDEVIAYGVLASGIEQLVAYLPF